MRADLGLIAEIGNRGVDFLLSDSTRSEKEGYTQSEATVGESLHQLVGEAAGRVIVATFASNIGRVQQVLDAAAAHGRKMVALGRSMEQNIAIAVELGYLDTARRHAGPQGPAAAPRQRGAGGHDHGLPG